MSEITSCDPQEFAAMQQLDQLNRGFNRQLAAEGITEEQALEELKSVKREVYTERYGRAGTKRSQAPESND